jgi:hypothetical protein
MSKYKLVASNYANTPITVIDMEAGWCVPIDNAEYLEWLEEGNTPEAADVPPAPTYKELRAAEYPSIVDQLDKIYHTGIDGWKTDIKVVKDKYPKE